MLAKALSLSSQSISFSEISWSTICLFSLIFLALRVQLTIFIFQNLGMHSTWNVFRGESKESSDMIFTTHTEHMIQFKTNVRVMLANKTSNNDDCDLRIKGSWSKGNCTISTGDSSTVVAQVVFLPLYIV
ncbi:putative tubby-like protein [Helianthus debilis subsp. tardiflorus]